METERTQSVVPAATKRLPSRRQRRNEEDIYAGERLRVARQLAGLTQQRLGELLGVSFQAVQKYENGENRLSAGRLVKAAELLGVTLAFFAKETARPEIAVVPTELSGDEIALLRAYRALKSDRLRSQLLRLTLTMAELDDAGASSYFR
jgi:transcriptional regulator with XRE-family HTH domain